MEYPKIPNNELDRTALLHQLDLLDTAAQEKFDRYTRLAREIFQVPTVLVSLVDESRQWFKSKVGMDACETARDVSFCGHAINQNSVFIVEDATQDARFADNPLVVKAPHIRFYAGVPIRVQGYNLGTLCLIDYQPRTLSAVQIEHLSELAQLLEAEVSTTHDETIDSQTQLTNAAGLASLLPAMAGAAMQESDALMLVIIDAKEEHQGVPSAKEVANLLLFHFAMTGIIARVSPCRFAVLVTSKQQQNTQEMLAMFKQELYAAWPGFPPTGCQDNIVHPQEFSTRDELVDRIQSLLQGE